MDGQADRGVDDEPAGDPPRLPPGEPPVDGTEAGDGDPANEGDVGTVADDAGTVADDAGTVADDAEEEMPPFLRYGIFTVVVYAVAVTLLVRGTAVDVGGPTLVAFTVGFLLFMTTYFAAMWAGWLLFS